MISFITRYISFTCTIPLILIFASVAESAQEPWQGDWRYNPYEDYGGHLRINNCNDSGCDYEISVGSNRGVCDSHGRFAFQTSTKAEHNRQERDYSGSIVQCSISFEITQNGNLVTDDSRNGCSYFCGRSANFHGEFVRVALTPYYRTSFNCLGSLQPIEMTICSSKLVAKQDVILSRLYTTLQKSLLHEQLLKLKAEQRDWIKIRNQVCGKSNATTACLDGFYRERINELNKWEQN